MWPVCAGCADTVDIGETAYAMVLADDMDGNGRLDLILATMNGNVYCFETTASYHPLKAWPSQVSPSACCNIHFPCSLCAARGPASQIRKPWRCIGDTKRCQWTFISLLMQGSSVNYAALEHCGAYVTVGTGVGAQRVRSAVQLGGGVCGGVQQGAARRAGADAGGALPDHRQAPAQRPLRQPLPKRHQRPLHRCCQAAGVHPPPTRQAFLRLFP